MVCGLWAIVPWGAAAEGSQPTQFSRSYTLTLILPKVQPRDINANSNERKKLCRVRVRVSVYNKWVIWYYTKSKIYCALVNWDLTLKPDLIGTWSDETLSFSVIVMYQLCFRWNAFSLASWSIATNEINTQRVQTCTNEHAYLTPLIYRT